MSFTCVKDRAVGRSIHKNGVILSCRRQTKSIFESKNALEPEHTKSLIREVLEGKSRVPITDPIRLHQQRLRVEGVRRHVQKRFIQDRVSSRSHFVANDRFPGA